MSQLLSDSPVSDPNGDLLNLAPDAKRLARLVSAVELPFTLGIYGAWGEGKTTFARFVVHYLKKHPSWSEAHFIEFSAWPYITADAIWRALVGQIARKIYNIKDTNPSPPAQGQPFGRLRRILNLNAFNFEEPPVNQDEDSFRAIMKRVSRNAGLAVRSADNGNPNDRAIARSILIEALSALVPSLKALVPLAGSDEDGESDPAADSIEELRTDLREMFATGKGTKFVIIVDDLDRCHPEVALDVLETIKVFFAESIGMSAQCLFIIAADETLIGKGLSARLKLQPYEVRQQNEEARLYLEKIIQLGVPVPTMDSMKAHRIVAAWSPGWAFASDIITAGLGTNLRRVKQQCSILSYRLEGTNAIHAEES